MSESVSVKVAVRCRPFNSREKERNAQLIIGMDGNKTTITDPATQKTRDFTFDYSYWSHDGFTKRESDGVLIADGAASKYADQAQVMSDLGSAVLENAWGGFNSCVFAHGQTGSGKSYSIVGFGADEGIIPLTCAEMFRRISAHKSTSVKFQVEVSMMEIYNEKMRDLLQPSKSDVLKIRETKQLGVYVDQLTTVAVKSYSEIERQMHAGTAHRTIGATQMNATSSRAHTIFTITFTQLGEMGGNRTESKSVINLVDLAGSERATSTGATGSRLKEGSAINLSLSALGQVITALAENASNPKKKTFVPYRGSVLTRLLQTALGGNSKTVMVAALSPADINYDETLQTLRYADNAKKIKTSATKNENPTVRLIRELREENEKLKAAMGGDMNALAASIGRGGLAEGDTPGEVAEAAKAAARAAEEAAAVAHEAAAVAKAELADAIARMQQLEALLAHGGGTLTAALAEADSEAAVAAREADALGNDVEKTAAKQELAILTAALEQIGASPHGGAVASATTAVCVKLARDETLADADAARDAVLKELNQDVLSAEERQLVDEAATLLLGSQVRNAALDLAGPAAREIVALRLLYLRRVQAARRGAAEAEGQLEAAAATERNSLESVDAAQQVAEAALAELAALRTFADEQSVELSELKQKSSAEREALMVVLQRKVDEAKQLGDQAKAVDFTLQLNRVAERIKVDETAKKLLEDQMESNERALKALEQSWDDKLQAASELEQKRQAVLDTLGLGKLEDGIDKTTPHLVNLNEDPNLNEQLLYFLKAGQTTVGAAQTCAIVLEGAGIVAQHVRIDVETSADAGAELVVTVTPLGTSNSFVNGEQLRGTLQLKHSDRVIFGARSVFRLVHPQERERRKAAGKADGGVSGGLIDWNSAQQELGDALGKAVAVKVDVEVQREREAMEDRLSRMAKSLDEERTKILESARDETGASASALARKEAEFATLQQRAQKLEALQSKLDAHVDAFRAELERVQQVLSTLMPAIYEANVIADAMGRKLRVDPRVLIEVPETKGLSPAQELMMHKTIALQVVLTKSGSEDREQQETIWTASQFTDRMHAVREFHYDYLKNNNNVEPGSHDDPFHSSPTPILIGRAYLSLAPLAHRLRTQHWLTVLDPLGRVRGELSCSLQPTGDDGVTAAAPLLESSALVGLPLTVKLVVKQARGLPELSNRNVFVQYTIDSEPTTTAVCSIKTSAPTFEHRDELYFPTVTADMVEYFLSDCLTFEVWGEPDAIVEGRVFEPPKSEAAMVAANPFDGVALPPEVFDFFVSLDIHECSTVERSERYQACAYDGGANTWGLVKGVYTLKQGRTRRLLIKLAQGQEQKYPVERCVRVWVTKVEDRNGNVVSSAAVPLSVLSTASMPDGSSATIVAAWFSGPPVLDELTAEGDVRHAPPAMHIATVRPHRDIKVLAVTFSVEVELTGLELTAPVKLTKKSNIRIESATGSGPSNSSTPSSVARTPAKKPASIFGGIFGGTPKPSAPKASVLPAVPIGTEEKLASLDPTRRTAMLGRQDSHHPVFMGSWERTDWSVVAQREDMLRVMASEFDVARGAQDVVESLTEGLARLQEMLQAEEQKQKVAFNVGLQTARRLAGTGSA